MTDSMQQARRISPENVGVVNLPKEINTVIGTTATLLTRPAGKKILYIAVRENSFLVKPGDYVARTFAFGGVAVGPPTIITDVAHGFTTGDGPYKMTTDDTLPTGIGANALLWVRVLSVDTYSLYDSYDGAMNGTVANRVDASDQGAGNHSLPEGVPDAIATTTDGYGSVQIERGTGSGHGIQSSSAAKVAAPDKITVQGEGAGSRLEYWWA